MMEESFPFKPSAWEYAFTCLGLLFFLLDIAMDVWTVVSLYQEEAYVYMGLMIFILLGSSVLLQVFSWIWYSESLDALETEVENKVINHNLMKPFHILQLGIHLRYAGVMEVSTKHFFCRTNTFREGLAVFLNHDLLMLRLIEAFAESAPQLILMMSLILQRGQLEHFMVFKLLTAAVSIASPVTLYHRGMRAFLQGNRKMSWASTGFFFLWNLILIISRVTALSLFCSVFSYYTIVHFLSFWMALVLVAWSQKTNFMRSNCEWLYRATKCTQSSDLMSPTRYAGIIEVSTRDFLYQQNVVEESAYLSNDLQMLRLFEAFSESAPQLTLMMCLTLQRGELELFTGFKLFSSAASIASVMSMYHHSMRVFLDKNPCTGTAVFFLWNLMLIIARVSALALFCSVFSCYITVHFLLWWMVLIFVAWRQKTNFMDSRGWECLYRASVGLIWYFSWFNISAGRKGFKSAIYHSIMGLDTAMLLGFWCWKVIEFGGCWRSLNPSIVIPVVLGLYICGILLQIVYYKLFHPQGDPQKIEELTESRQKVLGNRLKKRMALFYRTDPLVPDSRDSPVLPITGALNRSRTIATNFFF
ncbi:hypothetical protein DNTS_023833 [Danionella cerebrum]|uniref:XK-related protein n=1 Tax=Danionella cerebrum TaxID=2873325 RepID=A0A553QT16_9TELE|nr:hypothetical protein DNTS_023833 [Danionella translucida]